MYYFYITFDVFDITISVVLSHKTMEWCETLRKNNKQHLDFSQYFDSKNMNEYGHDSFRGKQHYFSIATYEILIAWVLGMQYAWNVQHDVIGMIFNFTLGYDRYKIMECHKS